MARKRIPRMLTQHSQARARWLRGKRQLHTNRTGNANSNTVSRKSPRSANHNATQQNAINAQQTEIRSVEEMRARCAICSTPVMRRAGPRTPGMQTERRPGVASSTIVKPGTVHCLFACCCSSYSALSLKNIASASGSELVCAII